jgi:hypothetical protein
MQVIYVSVGLICALSRKIEMFLSILGYKTAGEVLKLVKRKEVINYARQARSNNRQSVDLPLAIRQLDVELFLSWRGC